MLGHMLRSLAAHHQPQEPEFEELTLRRLEEVVLGRDVWRIQIDISGLVHAIIEGFYDNDTFHTYEHPWLLSSGQLPATVHNFVKTRDCFINVSGRPEVHVKFTPQKSGSQLVLFGQARWQLPDVSFPGLSLVLRPGDEYRIVPQYREKILDKGWKPMNDSSTDEPVFTVSSNNITLAWDADKSCFRAIVPSLERLNAQHREGLCSLTQNLPAESRTKTILEARVNIRFPGNVLFEQISRYSIKLGIDMTKPEHTGQDQSLPNDSANANDWSVREDTILPPYATPPDMPIKSQKATTGPEGTYITPALDGSPWIPSYAHTPASKCPRQESTEKLLPIESPIETDLSPNTHSVGQELRISNTRVSPWSLDGGRTDELGGQVDGLYQNQTLGVDLKGDGDILKKCKHTQEDTPKELVRTLEDMLKRHLHTDEDILGVLSQVEKTIHEAEAVCAVKLAEFEALREAIKNEVSLPSKSPCTHQLSAIGLQLDECSCLIPQKRKAIEASWPARSRTLDNVQHSGEELEPKRLKLGELGERKDSGVFLHTIVEMDVDRNVDSPQDRRCSFDYTAEKLDDDSALSPLTSQAEETNHEGATATETLEKWDSCKEMGLSRHDKSESNDQNPVPSKQMVACCHQSEGSESTESEQKRIQANYNQFVDLATCKPHDQSILYPFLEEERQAFERAFLSDSGASDWRTDDDDVSGTLDSMSLDE
ncbi:hypothetical protein BS50DRAFT_628003 [Corynespora cassiicola Philippines]|uniref:Uncharacterized protein n=1 Tax=Corynespora cassiicola Philippines TaxID=1448308 RepID=A0A2T2PAP7_CORCC|nr:hypothetical protein BS50DRAFT_628003 [Corynespora cassiicola Philippines]